MGILIPSKSAACRRGSPREMIWASANFGGGEIKTGAQQSFRRNGEIVEIELVERGHAFRSVRTDEIFSGFPCVTGKRNIKHPGLCANGLVPGSVFACRKRFYRQHIHRLRDVVSAIHLKRTPMT